jgi:hypothetical protein
MCNKQCHSKLVSKSVVRSGKILEIKIEYQSPTWTGNDSCHID